MGEISLILKITSYLPSFLSSFNKTHLVKLFVSPLKSMSFKNRRNHRANTVLNILKYHIHCFYDILKLNHVNHVIGAFQFIVKTL